MPSTIERASAVSQDGPPEALPQADGAVHESTSLGAKAADQAHRSAPAITSTSLPISMVVLPLSASKAPADARTQVFPGELELDFDETLAQAPDLSPGSAQSPKRSALQRAGLAFRRQVGFDGYRRGAHDEKLERDRRYGTVYSVTEGRKAYLVRLEMPRKMPASALRSLWKRTDQMPDYKYSVALEKNALIVKAGVPDESLRRLAYVSPSFPADFLTRIEFATPVAGFVHRLRDKILEAIVFKAANSFSPE